MKKLTILGSTGSIGTQTLEIVRYNKDIKVKDSNSGVYRFDRNPDPRCRACQRRS